MGSGQFCLHTRIQILHFSALVRFLQKDSDSLSEDEENNWDDFESEGCQDNFSVLVDSRVMLTKSDRSVRRPVRLDL